MLGKNSKEEWCIYINLKRQTKVKKFQILIKVSQFTLSGRTQISLVSHLIDPSKVGPPPYIHSSCVSAACMKKIQLVTSKWIERSWNNLITNKLVLEIKSHPSHSTVRLLKTSLQIASIQPLHLKEPPNGEADTNRPAKKMQAQIKNKFISTKTDSYANEPEKWKHIVQAPMQPL